MGENSVVVLGLGSNRSYQNQSPRQLLEAACHLLAQRVVGLQSSSLYRTAPMYYEEQEDFYNMAVAGRFAGSPRELLDFIHGVEAQLGRDRSKEFSNGPRSMDIDIELFGNQRVQEGDLTIPHPRMKERAFVLVPMLEVFLQNADLSIDRSFYTECLESLPHQEIERLQ
ncbi:MAG: 2-amino-4-hydroxy-6-hydroxymethyldihydropteridine diphosphokinase [Spirochaetaceae bacterium]|nr:2-amino-4-hydroxy-6-hydroxymethyldihydropteridine diphosphokinase [Spirochaetaceae bacterium]